MCASLEQDHWKTVLSVCRVFCMWKFWCGSVVKMATNMYRVGGEKNFPVLAFLSSFVIGAAVSRCACSLLHMCVCVQCVRMRVCCVWGGFPTITKVHFNCRKPFSGRPDARVCVCVCVYYQSQEQSVEKETFSIFFNFFEGAPCCSCVAAAASVFDVFQPISINLCPKCMRVCVF